jgi:hypothetical protein
MTAGLESEVFCLAARKKLSLLAKARWNKKRKEDKK